MTQRPGDDVVIIAPRWPWQMTIGIIVSIALGIALLAYTVLKPEPALPEYAPISMERTMHIVSSDIVKDGQCPFDSRIKSDCLLTHPVICNIYDENNDSHISYSYINLDNPQAPAIPGPRRVPLPIAPHSCFNDQLDIAVPVPEELYKGTWKLQGSIVTERHNDSILCPSSVPGPDESQAPPTCSATQQVTQSQTVNWESEKFTVE